MGHCSSSSCSTHSASDHSSKSGCGCGCSCGSTCGCNCHQCGCSCHHGKFSEELFNIADQAWMEIVKEKIKAEILSVSGDQLTQLAKLVSSANHKRWKDKMDSKKYLEHFEQDLKNIMNGSNR